MQPFLINYLFPGMELDNKARSYLRKVMSTLGSIIEDFLIYQSIKKDNNLRERLLVDVFQDRGKIDWFINKQKSRVDKLKLKKKQKC